LGVSVDVTVGSGDGKPMKKLETDAVTDLQLLVGAVSEFRIGVVDKSADPAVEYHS